MFHHPQLDQAERGFSFLRDGPLDMRMDTTTGISAAQWLADASESDIACVFKEYGEERYARRWPVQLFEREMRRPLLVLCS